MIYPGELVHIDSDSVTASSKDCYWYLFSNVDDLLITHSAKVYAHDVCMVIANTSVGAVRTKSNWIYVTTSSGGAGWRWAWDFKRFVV